MIAYQNRQPQLYTHPKGAKPRKEDNTTCKMAAKGIMTALNVIPKKHKTQILDAIAGLAPPLKGPRKLINDVFGFRARQVGSKNGKRKARRYGKGAGASRGALVGGNGVSINTVNAPVAFARTDTARPGFYIRHLDADTILVHSVDYAGEIFQVNASGGAGIFTTQEFDIDPTNPIVFSYVNPLLELFTKWKLTFLKAHYVHYCPTTKPGTIAVTYTPDIDTGAPANMGDMVNLNGAVSGACYEDFAYEANAKQFSKDWQYISPPGGTNEDDRLTMQGSIFVASDNVESIPAPGAETDTGVGRLLIESEFILTGRRVSSLMVALGKVKQIIRHKGSSRAEKISALTALVPELLDCEKPVPRHERTLAQIMKRQAPPPDTHTPAPAASTPSMIRGERLPR